MRILIALLLCLPLVAGLEITELQIDPAGSDNGLEYVEVIGSEDLAGCTIADSASSDMLEVLHREGEVALIVEEDGPYASWTNVTVYSAGKAIGNGLGNTADSITVTCDTELVSVAYDSVQGFLSGMSLYWDGAWSVGEATPGYIRSDDTIEENTSEDAFSERNAGACNSTLAITVSKTVVDENEEFSFTIISGSHASFIVAADDEIIMEGDTLTLREYTLRAPHAEEIMIRAFANSCDSDQRFTRRISILPAPEPVPPDDVLPQAAPDPPEEIEANMTEQIAAIEPAIPEETAPLQAPSLTANTVYDTDTNVLPWISVFGIATLGLSGFLIVRMQKAGEL